MLEYLRIQNLAILEDVEIRFKEGLNLLTGETGAGKSIVVDALGLAVGERAASDRIRSGAEQASVEAVFRVAGRDGLEEALRSLGVEPDPDDGFLIVRRELGGGGSRAFANGSPVTVGTLRKLSPWLVEVHGQHQHQTLLREENHRAILDAFAGAEPLAREVRADHAAHRALLERLDNIRERRADLDQRLDLLRFRLSEIDGVDPRAGEDADLRQKRDLLAHAGEIVALLGESRLLLEEAEEGAILSQVARLEENLRQLGAYDATAAAAAQDATAARSLLEDLAAALRNRPAEVELDPSELESVEARLSALAALARKHGGSLDRVLAVRDQAREELAALEADLEDPQQLEAEAKAAAEKLAASAARLSDLRRRRGRALHRAVEKELDELAMGGTRFRVGLERQEDPDSAVRVEGVPVRCDARGVDQVSFLLSPNPGEALRPLARIASGGELSRLMLALEGALRAGGRRRALPGCLVFDEVDAGIGGRVAAVVGQKLWRLGRERQVLCVTHLPQIASRADAHYRIEKKVEGGRTRTRVRPLEGNGRVAEVARMLGGSRVTRATRQHAAEMIAGSQ
jgi:DNA repair protein RecN (Recombination protein N)